MKIVEYSEKAIAVVGSDTKQVKAQLKAMGGRFNPRLSCGAGWIFPAKRRAQVEAFVNGGTVEEAAPAAKVQRAVVRAQYKAMYMAEMEKVWGGDAGMMKHVAGEFSGAVLLSGGRLLVFKKPRIQTEFCFGYSLSATSTESFDEANEMARHAGESEDYFLAQNLADFDKEIEDLENLDGRHALLHRKCYWGQKSPLNLWEYTVGNAPLEWFKESPTQDMDGLTRYVNQYHAGRFYYDLEELGDDDRAAILNGLKVERAKFEKRLRAYLKRYGTSKLKTWSYWQDA